MRNLSKELQSGINEERKKKRARRGRLHNRRGLALIVTVLILIPVGCLAALFLDAGRLYAIRVQMQVAADAAALAAASALIDGDEKGDSVQARAEHYVAMNPIQSSTAFLEFVDLNTESGTVRIVLRYQTSPLLWARGGLTVRMVAEARADGLHPGEIGRPVPPGNAFGWWKKKKEKNPGAPDSALVRLSS